MNLNRRAFVKLLGAAVVALGLPLPSQADDAEAEAPPPEEPTRAVDVGEVSEDDVWRAIHWQRDFLWDDSAICELRQRLAQVAAEETERQFMRMYYRGVPNVR